MVRFALYAGVGLLLLWGNFWYLKNAFHTYIEPAEPDLIAPFALVGKDDPTGNQGVALAHMLQSRLGRISQEVDSSRKSLAAAKQPGEQAGSLRSAIDGPGPQTDEPLPVPDGLFQPIDFNLAVGGVAVGSLLSTAHRFFSEHRLVHVTVEYAGANTVTAASFGQRPDHQLWIKTSDSNAEIISTLAYTIWQSRLSRSIPEVDAFEPKEFQELMETLHSAAELDQRNAAGRVSPEEWGKLLAKMGVLVKRTPDWLDLVRVTKNIAEKAERDEEVLRYVLAEGAILRSKRDALLAEETELKEQQAEDPSAIFRLARIGPQITKVNSEISDVDRDIASRSPAGRNAELARKGLEKAELGDAGDALKAGVLEVLGAVGLPGDGDGIKVAIVGGVPPASVLSGLDATTLPREPQVSGDDHLNEYVGALASAVQIVAPKAKFVFFPMNSLHRGAPDSEILLSLNALAEDEPDIIVFSFTLDETSKAALTRLVATLSIPVLVAAGNEPGLPPFSEDAQFYSSCIVVSGVDKEGNQARFAPASDVLFWSLGANVPVRLPRGNQTWNGTGPAVALAAGLVARILAEHHDLALTTLIDTLRSSSAPIGTETEDRPAVLNLKNALDTLQAPVVPEQ